MSTISASVTEVQIQFDGGIVIPAELRRQLELNPGDRLVIRIEANRLVLEKLEIVKQRLRERFTHLQGKGLIDDLLAERRGEINTGSKSLSEEQGGTY
jgi:AbrB family looped-hinge helix DNA binding protein